MTTQSASNANADERKPAPGGSRSAPKDAPGASTEAATRRLTLARESSEAAGKSAGAGKPDSDDAGEAPTRVSVAPGANPAAAAGAVGGVPSNRAATSSPSTTAPKSGRSGAPSLRSVNRGLSILVFLLICAVVFEMSKGLHALGTEMLPSVSGSGGGGGESGARAGADVEQIGPLKLYTDAVGAAQAARNGSTIFEPVQSIHPISTNVIPLGVILENVDIVLVAVDADNAGRSEVAVRVKQSKEVLYLKVGDKLQVLDSTVRVISISREGACFTNEKEEACKW